MCVCVYVVCVYVVCVCVVYVCGVLCGVFVDVVCGYGWSGCVVWVWLVGVCGDVREYALRACRQKHNCFSLCVL